MSSWHQHYTPQASLKRKMPSKMSEPCTPAKQVHTQPSTRAAKDIPPALPPPGRRKSAPATLRPRATPHLFLRFHSIIPESTDLLGFYCTSSTVYKIMFLALRSRVATTHAHIVTSTNTAHATHPTTGKTTPQARNNSHATTRQVTKTDTPTSRQQKTEDKTPQATPLPSQTPTRAITGHKGQTSHSTHSSSLTMGH